MSAGEGVALTSLKGNSANSVCGDLHAGALRASQSYAARGLAGEGLGQPPIQPGVRALPAELNKVMDGS